MVHTLDSAALMRGSKFEAGGEGCRRRQAQSGNSSDVFCAVATLASNMNSSTIELVSLSRSKFKGQINNTSNFTFIIWLTIELVSQSRSMVKLITQGTLLLHMVNNRVGFPVKVKGQIEIT